MAFLAPEIITRSPYNSSVDIWSLGVFIYYSLTGDIPFMPSNYSLDDMAINVCKKELNFSDNFKDKSKEVKDLISLNKSEDKRIKIEDLVKHQWFKNNI